VIVHCLEEKFLLNFFSFFLGGGGGGGGALLQTPTSSKIIDVASIFAFLFHVDMKVVCVCWSAVKYPLWSSNSKYLLTVVLWCAIDAFVLLKEFLCVCVCW
jgi:hypothetical protein